MIERERIAPQPGGREVPGAEPGAGFGQAALAPVALVVLEGGAAGVAQAGDGGEQGSRQSRIGAGGERRQPLQGRRNAGQIADQSAEAEAFVEQGAGPRRLAAGPRGPRQVGERIGDPAPVAQPSLQGQAFLDQRRRLFDRAKRQARRSEFAEQPGNRVWIVEPAMRAECLLEQLRRSIVVALLHRQVAPVLGHHRNAARVADPLEELQALLVPQRRVGRATLHPRRVAEVGERVGDSPGVVERSPPFQALGKQDGGAVPVPHGGHEDAEAAARQRHPVRIVGVASQGQTCPVERFRVVEVALPVREHALPVQDIRPQPLGNRAADRQGARRPVAALAQVATNLPEGRQPGAEAKG